MSQDRHVNFAEGETSQNARLVEVMENDDHKIGVCSGLWHYYKEHKAHVLVFFFSIVVGVGVGLGLLFGFNLTDTPVVAKRAFRQNQALQYGRILTNCFNSVPSNSSNNLESDLNDRCDIEKTRITFYVQNVTEENYELVAQIDDYQNFVVNSSFFNTSNISDLEFESFPNTTVKSIPNLFYFTVSIEGQFVALHTDRNVSADTVDLVKSILVQYTPKLNRHLYKSRVKTSTTFGRLLQGTSSQANTVVSEPEQHPQGYVNPERFIEEDSKESVVISKKYTDQSFTANTGFSSTNNKLDYNETTKFNKTNGQLAESNVTQKYRYEAPADDMFQMNFTAQTYSKFKLFYETNFDKDNSVYVFGQSVVPVKHRALAGLVEHRSLMPDRRENHFFDKMEAFFKQHKHLHMQEDVEERKYPSDPRLLEEKPGREDFGPSFKLKIWKEPKSVFDYKFDFFFEVKMYKDFYSQFDLKPDNTTLELWKPFIVAEYALVFMIFNDNNEKRLPIFTGASKFNTSLFDTYQRIEGYRNQFLDILKKTDEKIRKFFDSASNFFMKLVDMKKNLLDYSFNIFVLKVTFKIDITFKLGINFNTNIGDVYSRNVEVVKNYIDSLVQNYTTAILDKVPKNEIVIAVDQVRMNEFLAWSCESFKKWYWFFKTYYNCQNPDGSTTELTPDQYEKKSRDLDSLVGSYKSKFADLKKTYDEKFKNFLTNIKDSFRNDFFNKIDLKVDFGFGIWGGVEFDASMSVELPFITIGLKFNGTLVSASLDAKASLDLKGIVFDIKNAGKYVSVGVNITVIAFEIKAYLFYDKINCDWFFDNMKKFSDMLKNTRMRRLLIGEEFGLVAQEGEIHNRALQAVIIRNLGVKEIASEVWDFAKQIKNDVDVKCGFLSADKQPVYMQFNSFKIPSFRWNYYKPLTSFNQLAGKTE